MTDVVFAAETRQLQSFFARRAVPPSEVADAAQDAWLRYAELRAKGKFTDGGMQMMPSLGVQVLRERRKYQARRPLMLMGEFDEDVQPLQLQTSARCKPIKGERKPRVSEAVKAAILADLTAGELSKRAIARKHGVSHPTVVRFAASRPS